MDKKKEKIAFFDVDGTLLNTHIWSAILKYNVKFKRNILSTIWYLGSNIALTPLWIIKVISKEKYYRSWGETMPKMISGIHPSEIKEVFHLIFSEYLLPSLNKTISEKLKEHKKRDFVTVLTSGSFEELLRVIAIHCGVDFVVGTELETIGNKFTGRIIKPFCFGEGKLQKIKDLIKEEKLNINFKDSFAYSDSIFDLPMLELVGNPVAVNPDKNLLSIAQIRDWEII